MINSFEYSMARMLQIPEVLRCTFELLGWDLGKVEISHAGIFVDLNMYDIK